MNRDLSKFEPPKAELDGLTKELFGLQMERTSAKKSDFKIVDKKAEVDPCYGLETLRITKKDIAALLSGKKLYSTVNCDEYAITIEMEDEK